MTVDLKDRPVLLSLDEHGFYVLRYTAIPEQDKARVNFELVDPDTGGGASIEILADPKLIEDLNHFISGTNPGQAFLVWVDSSKGQIEWQIRKTEPQI